LGDPRHILQDFDSMYNSFLGDHALIDAALKAFTDWKPIRNEVLLQLELGNQERAAEITRTQGTPQVQLIESNIQKVVDSAALRAQEFNASAKDSAAYASSLVTGLLILSYIIAAIAVLLITKAKMRSAL